MSLRLATVNLFSGRSLTGGRVEPEVIGAAIADLGADVLAVQEVDHGQPRSGGHDQAALVARAAGAVDHRFVPLVAGTPGVPGWLPATHAHRGPGQHDPRYGIAVASRRPVEAWHVLRLGASRGRWPIPAPGGPRRLMWLADEPRAVLAAQLDDPPVVVAGTHLSFVPGVNVRQLRRARRWLADVAGPDRAVVLMGDLNLPGRLPARLTGWSSLVTGPTFPSPAPRVQIDHILGDRAGSPPELVSSRVVRLPFGDHCAVVADIEL